MPLWYSLFQFLCTPSWRKPHRSRRRPAPKPGGDNGNSVHAEIERLRASEGLDERGALKAIARARGISRSEAYRQFQLEKSAGKEPS
jgi:AraC-like DNA-binding protein